MKTKLSILILLSGFISLAQNNSFTTNEISINQYVDGTLLTPTNVTRPDLAIIIGGSGPTDRDGNQSFLKNNSLKKLAESLSNNNIATFRYDKRVVKQIRLAQIDNNILFDDFVEDAISVLDYFIKSNRYNHIHIIGHSQGSLVGMLAANNGADGFISIAGVAQPIDNIVIEQIEKTYPIFSKDAKRVFNTLRKGKKTNNYPAELASIFNKDVQGFMINWMQYNPEDEIKKLKIPVLILQGKKDLQVEIKEATKLHKALPQSKLAIIESMNHVLVSIEGDNLENSKSYNEPSRKISDVLINRIVDFIK
jgi:pimeloyl-ACP methyl ester carboxylesterase